MPIATLTISNFRNIQEAELFTCPQGVNIIYGNNGSGKTSLLEALHYLGLGRSFRSSNSSRLITHDTEKFLLSTQIVRDNALKLLLGAERDNKNNARMRLEGRDLTSVTELALLLPLRIINSQSHNLFELGPLYRRKFIDWGLFYHEESFLPCWRQFERVLKQRNTALREKRSKRELECWTEEFIKCSLQLNQLRYDYVEALKPKLNHFAQQFLNVEAIGMTYEPGWNKKQHLADLLENNYVDELRLGHTQYGPHRADLALAINECAVKYFFSRGQQKLLICAMILAQGALLQTLENKGLIYLIDDLPAELDLKSRTSLVTTLAQQQTQIFITAIEKEHISSSLSKFEVPVKVFHVEHGKVEAKQ